VIRRRRCDWLAAILGGRHRQNAFRQGGTARGDQYLARTCQQLDRGFGEEGMLLGAWAGVPSSDRLPRAVVAFHRADESGWLPKLFVPRANLAAAERRRAHATPENAPRMPCRRGRRSTFLLAYLPPQRRALCCASIVQRHSGCVSCKLAVDGVARRESDRGRRRGALGAAGKRRSQGRPRTCEGRRRKGSRQGPTSSSCRHLPTDKTVRPIHHWSDGSTIAYDATRRVDLPVLAEMGKRTSPDARDDHSPNRARREESL